ncbi:MAG: HAD family hydrolase [Bacteroidota bacterium]|nr:HAD family hydrolase [Bacteroidota bacterium]
MSQYSFTGVIFDLDGTLINSVEDLADSMNIVLTGNHYPVHDLSAYKTFIGNGIRNLVNIALPESARDEHTIEECYRQMMDVYNNNCVNKTKPYEGIIDLLSILKSREMKLGVFSNKADVFTKKIVQTLLPGYFDVIMGLNAEALKKPNPYGVLQICKKLDVSHENMVFVGDSGIDMKTAINAGMYGVGVLWGFRTKEELLADGAKCLLQHPLDLIRLLEKGRIIR